MSPLEVSDEPPPPPWPTTAAGRRRLTLATASFVFVFGTCLYSATAAEQLLLGWLYFPLQVLPRVTIDGPTALLGLACTVAFIAGLHATLRWLWPQLGKDASGEPKAWTLRATLRCSVAVFLLFAAGTAMVGTTHQAIWLFSGRHDAAADATPPLGVISLTQATTRMSIYRNNLKQLGLALHNFDDVHRRFPPGGLLNRQGHLMHGWAVFVAPYITYTYGGIDFSIPWDEPPNARFYRCAIPEFLNPSIPEIFDANGYGLSHVAGNVHVLPIVQVDSEAELTAGIRGDPRALAHGVSIADIVDGTTNTLLVGEVASRFKPWGSPANVRDPALGLGKSPDGFGGLPWAKAAQFLMCDGSVRMISHDVDASVIKALGTPAAADLVAE